MDANVLQFYNIILLLLYKVCFFFLCVGPKGDILLQLSENHKRLMLELDGVVRVST